VKNSCRGIKKQGLLFWVFIFIFLMVANQRAVAKQVDKEKAGNVAKQFLRVQTSAKKTKAKQLEKKGGKLQFSLKDIQTTEPKPISDASGNILAYVTELEPEGYIVMSADDRINPIIAYSFKGKFPFEDSKENVLLHLVQWDMIARQKTLNEKPKHTMLIIKDNSDKWKDYSSEREVVATDNLTLAEDFDTQTQWPDPANYDGYEGWITTYWCQKTSPYSLIEFNKKCPIGIEGGSTIITDASYRCPVGCTALATAQIMNYWKYPSLIIFDSSDSYSSHGKLHKKNEDGLPLDQYISQNIEIEGNHSQYDFPSFDELNDNLATIDYDQNADKIAYLCFGIGIKLKSDYGMYHGTGANMFKVPNVLKNDFSYGSANQSNGYVKQTVIENIKKGWPVEIGIARGIFHSDQHSAIIDGYDSITDKFHVNLGGEYPQDNCWYDLPVISPPLGNWGDWNLILTCVYDISPYFGWYQYGGNQENTFRTIYAAPTDEPIREKWKGTVNPNCKGMIVGSGNNIYITKDPLIINDPSYHPSIVILNQYGEKMYEKEITQTSSTISHPVQSQDGNIYFGAGDSIYKFRPDRKTCVSVYQDTGNYFYGDHAPRLDEDGRMYFGSDTMLVCVSSTGSELWSSPWACPSGGVMYTSIPSIDVGRNNVYISYWKSSTQTAHLVCINRLTGATKYEMSFPNITTADRGIYTPAIGSDGTVYTSVRTKIYALTPGSSSSSSFTEKWPAKDFYYARYQPIALGGDDTIYTEYWTYSGGSYYVTFAALDPDDGNVKWTVSKADVGDYTNFGQPYCAGNGIIIFPVKWDTNPDDTFELFAYRDNGSSGTELWKYDENHDENAKIAMGPGATVYLYQNNLITALSNGDLGDPDGGGMCYSNNIRPNLPDNPNPADETTGTDTTVTLSWSCSDPEDHSIKYSLFVGESGYDMIPIATELTSPSYQLTDLEPATSYRWMIVATDGQAVAEGPTWVFTTDVSADINRDGKINLLDYSLLNKNWQVADCNEVNDWCEKADIDKSSVVDFSDLLIIAENWLDDTSTTLSTKIAIINPDYYRVLKCGVVLNDNTYVSVASGEHADGDNLVGNPALWSGVGQHTDFIGTILEQASCQTDYFEASSMPDILASDYGIVIVQDPLRTNIVTFDKATVDAGNLPNLLEHVTDAGFISKIDSYVQSGGNLVLVGDAVRLLEDGTNRLNYGKTVSAVSPSNIVDQASSWIPGQWLFTRGNPFCGGDRNGSGQCAVSSGELLVTGTILSNVSINNRSDLPYSHVWPETTYIPSDAVSLLGVNFSGIGEYVLDGSICSPAVYYNAVDEAMNAYIGYTEHSGHKIYYIGSDSFFDYNFKDWEGTWHTSESMEINNAVTVFGINAILNLINHIYDSSGSGIQIDTYEEIYREDFNSGKPTQDWSYYSGDANGQIEVFDEKLRMDRLVSGGYTLNEAVLHLDLSSHTSLELSFWQAESNDEQTALPETFSGHFEGDGVSVSVDGVNWHTVSNASELNSGIGGSLYSINLDSLGLIYNNNFQIKFQQYDNYPWGSDGREFDDVVIYARD